MLFDTTLLIVAALVAGALNAMAGGGSFLTLPALVLTGIPAVSANATGTLALLPGYIAGGWGFRADTRPPPGLSAPRLGLLCLLGGSTGAVLLLLTPDATFRRVVPWLLLLATFLFTASPRLAAADKPEAARPVPAMLGVFAVTAYGGYFNGGLGILLLALLGLLGQKNLHAMNGLKNQLSALLTLIAVSLYAWGGLIAWREALVMMGAAMLGGYAGARVARRLPLVWLRRAIVATGLTMSGLFFLR
ncbi:sulfite exporter TauE/SafE family protein [Variovorax paradoxus]|uniref:sulfite exporter TauE/SafE family protein n=1 Tax=Variovorax paradoxus TaxID=34073 RepID=UPI001ABD326F